MSPGTDDEGGSLEARVARVVVDVVRTAARDARRGRLLVRDADSPEGALLARWLEEAGLAVERAAGRDGTHARAREADADALLLDPANKTVAVLWPETLTAPLLPLADLYATQVARLAGDWSAPAPARAWLEHAGVEAVDAALIRHLDERRPLDEALDGLPANVADELRRLLRDGWWWRRRLGVVPKLGSRTLGIDFR